MGSNSEKSARSLILKYRRGWHKNISSFKPATGLSGGSGETNTEDVLDAPFTCEELRFKMRRLLVKSAPGITYLTWKTRGQLLTIIYKVCPNREQIPDSWKVSTTVLAYKIRKTG